MACNDIPRCLFYPDAFFNRFLQIASEDAHQTCKHSSLSLLHCF